MLKNTLSWITERWNSQKTHSFLDLNTQYANYFWSGFCSMPHSWTLSWSNRQLNLTSEHHKWLGRREAVRGVDAILPSCWEELKIQPSFLLGGMTRQAKQNLIWVIKSHKYHPTDDTSNPALDSDQPI